MQLELLLFPEIANKANNNQWIKFAISQRIILQRIILHFLSSPCSATNFMSVGSQAAVNEIY